eukprot:Hpha_TRINITY_DN21221_c0_g1::TRINITY_DN21221_c0_g1_i1::g.171592::m.171592
MPETGSPHDQWCACGAACEKKPVPDRFTVSVARASLIRIAQCCARRCHELKVQQFLEDEKTYTESNMGVTMRSQSMCSHFSSRSRANTDRRFSINMNLMGDLDNTQGLVGTVARTPRLHRTPLQGPTHDPPESIPSFSVTPAPSPPP